MWIFTRYGFFSIVCLRKPDCDIDPDVIFVRARSEKHLRNLQDRFPELQGLEIVTSEEGDYPFRIILPKRQGAALIHEMALEIEWPNFRNAVIDYQGRDEQSYLDAIHDVWDRMAHL